MQNGSKNEGTFQDPLENYDPKVYHDRLEQAIAEQPVTQTQHQPHASISPDATVREAVRKMADEHVACLMVEEDGKLIGVFTDREVLNKVALDLDQLERPVREIMTANPIYVFATDPVAAALCVMAAYGFRHVPIVNAETGVLGIVSPQRMTGFLAKNAEP